MFSFNLIFICLQATLLKSNFYRGICCKNSFSTVRSVLVLALFSGFGMTGHALILSKLLFEGRKLQEPGMCCILDMQENREEPSKQSQTTISWDHPHRCPPDVRHAKHLPGEKKTTQKLHLHEFLQPHSKGCHFCRLVEADAFNPNLQDFFLPKMGCFFSILDLLSCHMCKAGVIFQTAVNFQWKSMDTQHVPITPVSQLWWLGASKLRGTQQYLLIYMSMAIVINTSKIVHSLKHPLVR